MTFLLLVAGSLVGDLFGWWLCPAKVWRVVIGIAAPRGQAQTVLLMTLPLLRKLFVQRIAR